MVLNNKSLVGSTNLWNRYFGIYMCMWVAVIEKQLNNKELFEGLENMILE